jgi:hypothetical protein
MAGDIKSERWARSFRNRGRHRAESAGLVKGEGFAVDASVMEANASRYYGKAPDELDWSDAQRQKRAVAEYLAGLEAEAPVQEGGDGRGGGPDGEPTPKPDRKPPKVISPSDPSSAWTAKANKRVQFGYGLNYLIDVRQNSAASPAESFGGARSFCGPPYWFEVNDFLQSFAAKQGVERRQHEQRQ